MAEDSDARFELELVQRSRRGDVDAFEQLFHKYYRMVVGIGYRYTGDTVAAEDVAQETFLKAWTHLPGFDPKHTGSFRVWLAHIARTSAIDLLRKRKPAVPLDESWQGNDGTVLDAEVERLERARDVQEAIFRLPEKSREVLILREYGELSYAEIAEMLGIPIGTVMSRLNYARKALKQELKEYLGR